MIATIPIQTNAECDESRTTPGALEFDVDPDSLQPTGHRAVYVNGDMSWPIPVAAAVAMVGGPQRFRELVAEAVDWPEVARARRAS